MAASPQAPSATQAASRLKEQEAQRLIQLRGASLFAPTNPSPVVAYNLSILFLPRFCTTCLAVQPALCPLASPIGDQSQAACTCIGLRNGT